MNYDIKMIKGTDVNYYFICRRRAWMSIHSFYVIDKNEFVEHGSFLNNRNRKYGYHGIRIGQNEIDNLEIDKDGNYIVHEFKRGHKALDGDIFQILHYIELLENQGFIVKYGVLHLLGSNKIRIIEKTQDLLSRLENAYENINILRNDKMPAPVKNYYCSHGCSYAFFCWG
jgi:CRISPR-associated exonuclease Cas4